MHHREIDEDDVLITCALRFDGYAYQRATGYDINDDDAIETFWRTGEWPEDVTRRMANFFFLQRGLFKWDLEYEPRHGRYWRAFRSLFLTVWDADPPEPYVHEAYAGEWRRDYAGRLPEVVEKIRATHAATPYDDDAPPSLG